MEEVDIKDLFFILRKRLEMIILLILISILITGIFSFLILKPKYEASTTLMAGKPSGNQFQGGREYDDLMINEKLVHTYATLIRSKDVSENVITNLGLGISFKKFSKKINVDLVENTEIIKIMVIDKNPNTAAEIANETADVFIDSVREFMDIESIQIIDRAEIPDKPIRPRPILNMAIGGVLGIMIGVFTTFILEYLDQSIKTPEDVEKYLKLSNLGAIPKVDSKEINLISLVDPKSPITEAFRTLRTNIQFSNIDKDLQTLVITSSTRSEGKSTIATNIAGTIAQDNKRVLLIDCDLRKPRIHRIARVINTEGLTNILAGENTMDEVSFMYQRLENLHMLTTGPIPPNPSELLGSKKMKGFIEEIKKEYDIIILDCPPVGIVTDAAILSNIVDGVILVAAVAETNIDDVVRTKELLDKANANIIGTVLNKVPIGGRSQYKYGYYQNYGYYEEDIDKRYRQYYKTKRNIFRE